VQNSYVGVIFFWWLSLTLPFFFLPPVLIFFGVAHPCLFAA